MIRFRLKNECWIKRKEYIKQLEVYTGVTLKDIPYNADSDVFGAYNRKKGILGIDSIDDEFLENYNCEDYANDKEENIKLIYFKLNYPYEFYLAYFKTYYSAYTLKELVENKDKYLSKEIVNNEYNLERAALTIEEAYNRNVKLDTLDSLSLEGIIGLTSKKLFQKVKLMLEVNDELLTSELNEAIELGKPALVYYKNNYETVSKYTEYVMDVLDFIEYKLKDKKGREVKEALERIRVFKNKIYTLK